MRSHTRTNQWQPWNSYMRGLEMAIQREEGRGGKVGGLGLSILKLCFHSKYSVFNYIEVFIWGSFGKGLMGDLGC